MFPHVTKVETEIAIVPYGTEGSISIRYLVERVKKETEKPTRFSTSDPEFYICENSRAVRCGRGKEGLKIAAQRSFEVTGKILCNSSRVFDWDQGNNSPIYKPRE